MTPRSQGQVLAEMLALLPPGEALPHAPEDQVAGLLRPLAEELRAFEAVRIRLVAQSAPAVAEELLADYERVLGPDPCRRDVTLLPVAQRQARADLRWNAGIDPTPAQFVRLAAQLGASITVETFLPPRSGTARCGAARCAPPTEVYGWKIHLAPSRVVRARCGATRCGEPIGAIQANGVECDLRQMVPQHTLCVFVYDL